jgi:ribonuclease BN (tRNA processing enzyme)
MIAYRRPTVMQSSIAGMLAIATLGNPAVGAVPAGKIPTSDVAKDAPTSTRLVLLGTAGGPIARAKRSQPANLLEVGDHLYLVDAGDGVVGQLAKLGISPTAVSSVFITHLHMDHIAGLATLTSFGWVARRKDPIRIYGPIGLKSVMNGVAHYMAIPESIFAAELPPGPSLASTWSAEEIAGHGPNVIYQDSCVKVTAVENSHYQTIDRKRFAVDSRSYALRFDTPNRSIVFTGDSGPSQDIINLAKGADILVSEVIDVADAINLLGRQYHVPASQLEPQLAHMRSEHLSPEDVGHIAAEAGVKMVVLSHIVLGGDDDSDLRHYSDGVRNFFKGPVIVGQDLDQF